MHQIKPLLFSFVILLLALSCTKEEGQNGRASIQGKILVSQIDPASGFVVKEYYGAEERVYIVYGDDDFYGDELRTHHDGTFRFDYLSQGSYQVYAYSFCASCPSRTEAIIVPIEITENNEEINLEDLVITKD